MPTLNLLKCKTILDIEFDAIVTTDDGRQITVKELVAKSFNTLSGCGPDKSYYSVAASKILHTINPELFVMWDNPIQSKYGISNSGYEYTYRFLPKMQRLLERAVNQVTRREKCSRDDAIKWLTSQCKHKNSLAKIIDEYNYVISR